MNFNRKINQEQLPMFCLTRFEVFTLVNTKIIAMWCHEFWYKIINSLEKSDPSIFRIAEYDYVSYLLKDPLLLRVLKQSEQG